MIHIELEPDIQMSLMTKATTQGVSPEKYVQELIARDVAMERKSVWVRFGPGTRTPAQAARDIAELRKRNTLGGLKIKDLVHEGHKY